LVGERFGLDFDRLGLGGDGAEEGEAEQSKGAGSHASSQMVKVGASNSIILMPSSIFRHLGDAKGSGRA
jgi:hypothetical protein